MKILHLIIKPREILMAYNEFPLVQRQYFDVSICSYMQSEVDVPSDISFFEGNNRLFSNMKFTHNILMNNEFDVIHIHNPHQGVLFLFLTIFNQKLRQKTLYTFHNSFPSYNFRNKLLLILNLMFQKNFVHCSNASYQSLPKLLTKFIRKQRYVIPNGVNIERIDDAIGKTRAKEHKDDSKFSILFIGRLIDIKNPKMLIEICAELDKRFENLDWELIMIGDGYLRLSLEKMIQDRGISDKVQFTGIIRREKVYENAVNRTILVSTSNGEGLPIAVLEAMACGLPLVLSDISPHQDIGGVVDFIPLCEPNNADGFLREITKFIDMTLEQRSVIGKQCRKLVQEKFGLDVMLEQYHQLYRKIATQGAQKTSR